MATQKLTHDASTGLSHWHIAGAGCFPANDRAKCAAYGVPVIGTDADTAASLLASWADMGAPADMVADYARDLANEPEGVLKAMEALATPENRARLIIEEAKDEINRRFLEATEDYGYMDAKAEGYAARRG